jgi:hypothetical protein
MKTQHTTPPSPTSQKPGTTEKPAKPGRKKKATAQEERLQEEAEHARQPTVQNSPSDNVRVNEDEQRKAVNREDITSDITPEDTDS